MKYKLAKVTAYTCRGYAINDDGTLEIVDVACIDNKPVNYLGEEYNLSGPIEVLQGWPDQLAIRVTSTLLVGIRAGTIDVTWKSTGAICTVFERFNTFKKWLSTAENNVTSRLGSHPSVDLRDVDIPADDYEQALEEIYMEENNE